MPDDITDATPPKPIEVSANAGAIDAAMAAFRYIGFLVTALTAIFGLIKTRDLAGLIDFVKTNGGEIVTAVSSLVAIGIATYGVLKTRFRGAQIASVAADRRVPNAVARLK